MWTLLIGLLALLAWQALSDVTARKVRKTKGPFLGPWIENHREQILSHTGKNKTPKNISQALFAGENTGCSMPWFALIQSEEDICGGTLVSKRHVLSAHGCIIFSAYEEVKMQVVLGAYSDDQTTERENYEFTRGDLVTHPDYNWLNDSYGIALIKLFEDVTFNDFIAPIKIWTEEKDWTGTAATFAGMGAYWDEDILSLVYPTGLEELTQEIQTEEFCTTKLIEVKEFCTNKLIGFTEFCVAEPEESYNHEMHMCTANSGFVGRANWGDAGGPLFIYDENMEPWLIGLIGYQSMVNYGAGSPTKHIRLSYYLCWLIDMSNGELDIPNISCTSGGESACDLKRSLALKNLKVQATKKQKVQKKLNAKKFKKNQKKSQRGVKPIRT